MVLKKIDYKKLEISDIDINLFSKFNRYQDVKKCWRKENGEWILKEIPFVEQWNTDEYKFLVKCLRNTVNEGGAVFGAFDNDSLVGFASLENKFFGSENQYLQLSSIHISAEARGHKIGKKLFYLISMKAKKLGAQKLYISAHSSEETQGFYKSLGCVEALEYNLDLVSKEPFDCQLEYTLLK
nr:GNAT family N-acetyltransferase [Acetoanaerobium pronyense]